LQDWIDLPASFLSKRDRFMVTIYGPYGKWLSKLRKICEYLRQVHGFQDCLPVIDRHGFRKQRRGEKSQVYDMKRSYYFLDVSHANLFVFYCNAYNQSVDFELKQVLDKLPDKIRSSIILRDSSCEMGKIFEGEIINAKIKSDCFNGLSQNPEREISDIANAYCLNILKRDFYLL
jgi:hypothetical protein